MFLRNLRHPSIINMVGACMKPWALIMELAPLGSLSSLLNNGQALSRGIQHRIALQVLSVNIARFKVDRSLVHFLTFAQFHLWFTRIWNF